MTQCCRMLVIATYVTMFSLSIDVWGADWPQWRGPLRDGKSAETGLLGQWPDGGPKLVWQVNDLGSGYSTPSVAGDKLYVVRNRDMDQEEVIALSLADGQLLWATPIGKVGPNQGPQYPAARSTPTVDGDRLYVLGSDGDFACLSAIDGKLVWSKNFRTEFQGKPGKWAYSESPLVDGDVVIATPGGSDATIVALKKSDGSVQWKAPLAEGDEAGYASVVHFAANGVKQYVQYLEKGVVGVNAATGDLLWRYTKTAEGSPANILTPVVDGTRVYTGAGRSQGGLVEINSQGQPQELYASKSLPTGIGGAVLVGNHLYGSSGQTFMCVEFATGKEAWQDRAIGASSVCYVDGKLILHGENNEVAMVAASPDGYKLLGHFTPANAPDRGKSKAWTYPVVANGKLYIRDVGTIWCYDIAE